MQHGRTYVNKRDFPKGQASQLARMKPDNLFQGHEWRSQMMRHHQYWQTRMQLVKGVVKECKMFFTQVQEILYFNKFLSLQFSSINEMVLVSEGHGK